METHSQDLRVHQCGKVGLFLQAAFLGMMCCEVTVLHNRVLGGCSTPCMVTSNRAPVNRHCCILHVMFDYFIIVVATGMNGHTPFLSEIF